MTRTRRPDGHSHLGLKRREDPRLKASHSHLGKGEDDAPVDQMERKKRGAVHVARPHTHAPIDDEDEYSVPAGQLQMSAEPSLSTPLEQAQKSAARFREAHRSGDASAGEMLADHLENGLIPLLEREQRRSSGKSEGRQAAVASALGEARAELSLLRPPLPRTKPAKPDPIGETSAGVFAGFADELRVIPSGEQALGKFALTVSSPGAKRAVQVEVDAKSKPVHDESGTLMRTLEISRSTQLKRTADVEAGAGGLSVTQFRGESMSYALSLPEAAYQEVLRGERAFPDPGNPSTLPPGSSLLIRDEDLVGGDLSARFGLFSVSAAEGGAKGTALGIERAGDGQLRVMSGPTEAVTRGLGAGIGKTFDIDGFALGAAVQIGSETQTRQTELRFLDLDPKTGGAAYARFLNSGDVDEGARGGRVILRESERAFGVGGSLTIGELEFSGLVYRGDPTTAVHGRVEHADGRREVSAEIRNDEGTSLFARALYDKDGALVDERHTLSFEGLARGHGLAMRAGAGPDEYPPVVRLELTPSGFRALRARARAAVQNGAQMSHQKFALVEMAAGADDFRGFISAITRGHSRDDVDVSFARVSTLAAFAPDLFSAAKDQQGSYTVRLANESRRAR